MKGSRTLLLYPNRRLYDPLVSKYITYDDVLQMVRQGIRIHVSDRAGRRDYTMKVLRDVFIREELRCGSGEAVLTTPALLNLIQMHEGSDRDALSEYLSFSLNELTTAARASPADSSVEPDCAH